MWSMRVSPSISVETSKTKASIGVPVSVLSIDPRDPESVMEMGASFSSSWTGPSETSDSVAHARKLLAKSKDMNCQMCKK